MVLKSSVEPGGRSRVDVETAIRQLVSKAIIADGVIDVFDAAGLKKPDLSILSDEFLSEIRELPHTNLAVEARGDQLKLTEDELAFYDALELDDLKSESTLFCTSC
jgi:type I restriction enzyme, R subunit